MSISLLLIGAIVVAALVLAGVFVGGRTAMGAVVAAVALACLAAVGWFAFRPLAPPAAPPVATPPTTTAKGPGEEPAAPSVATPAPPETRGVRAIVGTVVAWGAAAEEDPTEDGDGTASGAEGEMDGDDDGSGDLPVRVRMSLRLGGRETTAESAGVRPTGKAPKGAVPAAGALVEVFPGDADVASPGEPILTVSSGEDGRFRTDAAPAGPVLLRARRDAFRSLFVRHVAGDVDPVLALLGTGAVRGRVTEEKTGRPVAGARVVAGRSAGARTDAEGRYEIAAAPRPRNDRVRVDVTARGYESGVNVAEYDDQGAAALDFELKPAAVLSGVVYAPDGKPAPGAAVTLEREQRMGMAGAFHLPAGVTTADASGRYAFEGAPAGAALRLQARTDRAISPRVDVEAIAAGTERTDADLHLAPAGRLLVRVTDAAGGAVVGAMVTVTPRAEEDEAPRGRRAGFVAAIAERNEGVSAASDASGLATVGPVPPGPVGVAVRMADFLPAEAPAISVADQDTEVAVTLEVGGAVSGRVVDDTGAPVEGASVSASRVGMGAGGFFHEARTSDAEGAFRIAGLDAKPVSLEASKADHVAARLQNVRAGSTDLVITMARGGAVRGIARGPDGEPLRSFRVLTDRTDVKKAANPMDSESFLGMGGAEFEDETGAFRVGGLEAGTYRVTVRAPNLAPGRVEDVKVTPGGETAVEVTCPEGITLRGIVVARSDGRPLAGATIQRVEGGLFGSMDVEFEMGEGEAADAAREAMGAMFSGGAGSTTSGADGTFALKGLEEGKVNLRVGAKEFAKRTMKDIAVPSATDVRIELNEGGIVTGRVTDMAGQPLKGMAVMLQRVPFTIRTTQTAEDGTYRVGGLASGSYLFYVMDDLTSMMGGGGAGGFNLKSESVRVEEGKTVVKDFRRGDGIKVTGRVTRAGKPVPDVMVMLVPGSARGNNPMSAMMGGTGFAMGSTNADGKYEITGVNPGRYTAMVQTNAMGGGAAGGSEPVEVSAGSAVVVRDIALPVSLVRGVVVTADGAPVAGAQVVVVAPGTDLTRFADLGEVMEAMGGQTYTDDAGRFAVEGVKPGTYTVRASSREHGTVHVENVTAAADPPEIRLVLAGNLPIHVRVVGADGAAVGGASVYIVGGAGEDLSQVDGFDLVRTDAEGRVELRAPAGTITIEAVAQGHGPGSASATVPGSGEIVVRLPAECALEVIATGPSGAAAGATVELLDGDGKPYRQRFRFEALGDLLGGLQTDGQGRFSKRDLPAGAYRVRVSHEGRTAEAATSLSPGETRRVELTLR